MRFDVLFLHPPAVYDFRKRPFFPGPVAETVAHYTSVLIAIPVGVVSMADQLDRNGYKVKIYNLGELMLMDEELDIESFLRKTKAKAYAIDLHWCAHSQGAVEIAKICKKVHPDSTVVVGGLTATRFDDELVRKYPFVDIVLRGESEESVVKLAEDLDRGRTFEEVPNATFRKSDGSIQINRILRPCEDLDSYNFSRLDLIEPKAAMLVSSTGLSTWITPVCRGCTYNCVSCGGSRYSYRVLFGREKPAFRSPEKIVEDLTSLREQGVDAVFLFQDPRLGGNTYWTELASALKKERTDLKQLGIELFEPANEEFVRAFASTGIPIIMNISPESAVEKARESHGRVYSNEALLKTVEYCHGNKVRLSIFFMIGLAGETSETFEETLRFCEKLYRLDSDWRSSDEEQFIGSLWFKPKIGSMILLDPGSLAFDYPERFGYRLRFQCFEDYYLGLSMPSWHQWVSYETSYLTRQDLCELTLNSLEHLLDLDEKYGLHTSPEEISRLNFERFRKSLDRFLVNEVETISLSLSEDKCSQLGSLKEVVDTYLDLGPWSKSAMALTEDEYGYSTRINELLHNSMGLVGYSLPHL